MPEDDRRPRAFAAGDPGVVIYVKDLPRMRRFYEACFGMWCLEAGGERFTVLGAPGWELSLVTMSAAVASTVEIADPPRPREETPIKLSLEVASIAAVAPLVREAGGQIEPGTNEWSFRRRRHLDCLDPEGNVLQLREPLEPTLAGRELTGRDFGGGELSEVSFAGSNLTNARFAGADLAGARFEGSNLTRADFADARLEGASFADANLTWATLARAGARAADFRGSNLTGCDLGAADLGGATLHLVCLNYANLEGTDFDGADLSGAVGVRMRGEPKRLPDGWSLRDGCLVEDA